MKPEYLVLTVHEFRKNMKAALDTALEGNIVVIDRMGQRFSITHIPRGIELSVGVIPAKAIIEPTPEKNKSEPSAQSKDEFTEAEHAGELPCCKLKSPCKHWQYDDQRQVWANGRSGRERGAE